MTTIPVIDISPALNGGDVGPVVEALRAAITEVGFLQIIGHGFPKELLDRAYASMWELEGDEEMLAAMVRPRQLSRGVYQRHDEGGRIERMSMQFIPYDTPEEVVALGADRGHLDYFDANVWPEGHPEFRDTWKEYQEATRALGRLLMGLCALGLGLPRDGFESMLEHDVTLYSVNWYTPLAPDRLADGPVVMNPSHADSGVLTVLHQRGDYEGLQVRGAAGEWVTVPLMDDAFVLNVGHLMRRMTNNTWPATLHRVLSGPTPEHSRKSIAMHFLPNIDAVIEPLPSTVGEDGPKFEPISTYDWQHKFMAQYALPTWSKPLPQLATVS